MTDFEYVGTELELFAMVHNWKCYWARRLRPFIVGDVVEVGAGIGANTPFLNPKMNSRWVCLEPDARLLAQLNGSLAQSGQLRYCEIACGTLDSLDARDRFDTILYIDVLEHIENDRKELENAASHLRDGGRIIVLAPAHSWLFTPFDASIGHFRRYNRRMLKEITPSGLHPEKLIYLDSAGLLLSLANRLLLRQSMPSKEQLRIWDGVIIPVSRVLDGCLLNAVGKSVVGVWKKQEE